MVFPDMAVTLPSAETSHLSGSRRPLLRWNPDSGLLVPLTDWPIPAELCPWPERPWLPQLTAAEHAQMSALLSSGNAGFISCQRPPEQWLLECIPDGNDWLILVHSLSMNPVSTDPHGLLLLECERAQPDWTDTEHNRVLLQRLFTASHCDRLVIWEFNREQMHPRFVLGERDYPAEQPLEPRYLKALKARGTLGFSDIRHQPALVQQRYLQQDGILARLDALLLREQHAYGVLTLEYRSWQSRFEPGLFALAAKVAERLLQPLPDRHRPYALIDPWLMTQLSMLQREPNLSGLRTLQAAWLHDWNASLRVWNYHAAEEQLQGVAALDTVGGWSLRDSEQHLLTSGSPPFTPQQLPSFPTDCLPQQGDNALWIWPVLDESSRLLAVLALQIAMPAAQLADIWQLMTPSLRQALSPAIAAADAVLPTAALEAWLPPVLMLDRHLAVTYVSPALTQAFPDSPWQQELAQWLQCDRLTRPQLRQLLHATETQLTVSCRHEAGTPTLSLTIRPQRDAGRLQGWLIHIDPPSPSDEAWHDASDDPKKGA